MGEVPFAKLWPRLTVTRGRGRLSCGSSILAEKEPQMLVCLTERVKLLVR